MPVTYFTHTDASEALLASGARKVSAFSKALAERAEGTDTLVAEALRDDNPRRVQGIPYRHLLPKGMRRTVRKALAEIHGAEALEWRTCPALLAEGIDDAAQYASAKVNRREGESAALRASTYRCPLCLAGDVVVTLRKYAERDEAARWNTRGA